TLSGNRIAAGDVDLAVNLNIYPNPTRGIFNISFVSEEVDNFEITIIDAFGKMVSNEYKQDFIGEYAKTVDLSNWKRGVYMVQIQTQNSFVSKRIVLQ
ncbi:MAG: T9SS type A sorting domain-containing protein, partial [Bacteroidota bacterium]|nr:T9SS type A sorting domain-containing protein [Bacteroidota bacterium]